MPYMLPLAIRIARKTKVSLKHPLRYSGAINYVLDEARVSGHLFLSVDETVGQCYELLNMGCDDEVVSEEEIRQAITNERVEYLICHVILSKWLNFLV